jgi:ribonuclease VapC
MIVVDSSALIAIVEEEPEQQAFMKIIAEEDHCLISAVNAHETAMVLRGRRGPVAVERFWRFLSDNKIRIVPFDEAQVRAAASAFARYGKGIHPRARLNLADCAAYALADTMGLPLLFKGSDFAETDIGRRL